MSPEAAVEVLPRHLWVFAVARAGHFCSAEVNVRDAASGVQDAFPSSKERGRQKARNRFGPDAAAEGGPRRAAAGAGAEGSVAAAAAKVAELERAKKGSSLAGLFL